MLQGSHEPGFEALARQLEEILSAPPFGGAALSFYDRGRLVFDMWGGAKNNEGEAWERDTPALSYSTGKPVVASALHILRDRGLVQYDKPVAHYWPEFAQNGKGTITVRQALTHSAGLHAVRTIIDHADVLLDWDATIKALERAPAAHAPGRYHAYHAITFGHLIGEIVRRVSGKSVGQFVRDEIAEPLGLRDFYFGAPPEVIARTARIIVKPRRENFDKERARARAQQREQRMKLIARGLNLVGIPMSPERMFNSFSATGINKWDFSSPEVLGACIPAANGVFAARDLARFYAALANGGSLDGTRVVSKETLREATQVHTSRPDGVLVLPMRWRLGYHGVFSTRGLVRNAFGHSGYNGSGGWASPNHNAGFAFVVNAGIGTPVGDMRMLRLTTIALACQKAYRKKHAA
ncbi:MAG TPA: serine hydrolase domain-containing protein [Polyangiales bacterium]|nr:serine hydrolase domain-containing protein [Polyangiales bacterium]